MIISLKRNKRLMITGIVALLIVATSVIWFNILFPPPISYARMERVFQKDQAMLISVSIYFKNSDYSSIYISNSHKSGFMSAFTSDDKMGELVSIEDTEIVRILDTLLNIRGYQAIIKKGNTIHFQRWSTLDAGRGIAHTLDGNAPQMQYLTY